MNKSRLMLSTLAAMLLFFSHLILLNQPFCNFGDSKRSQSGQSLVQMAALLAIMAKTKRDVLHGSMLLPHGLILISSSLVLTDGKSKEAQLRQLNVVVLPSSVASPKLEKDASCPEPLTCRLTIGSSSRSS